MNIPFSVKDIVASPMEEFNNMLLSHTLTEEQLHMCKDIRRRGKNKIAAQNCRARKMEQIQSLEYDLSSARRRKEVLMKERVQLLREKKEWELRLDRLDAVINK